MKAPAVIAAAVGAAVIAGALLVDRDVEPRDLSVQWANKPAAVVCEWATVLDEATKLYSRLQICGPADAGRPQLPRGLGVTEVGDRAPADGGDSMVEAGEVECACSTGNNCDILDGDKWVTAPIGVTLEKWQGAGCVRMPCVVLWRDDVTFWPRECP